MVNYKSFLKKLLRENISKSSLSKKETTEWYMLENNLDVHPNYLCAWNSALSIYALYSKKNKTYYFYWDKILKDFNIKFKEQKKDVIK